MPCRGPLFNFVKRPNTLANDLLRFVSAPHETLSSAMVYTESDLALGNFVRNCDSCLNTLALSTDEDWSEGDGAHETAIVQTYVTTLGDRISYGYPPGDRQFIRDKIIKVQHLLSLPVASDGFVWG